MNWKVITNWSAWWEAVKEPLRWLVLAIIPLLLERLALINIWWAIVLITLLRVIDKYLHELAPEGESGGLVRF
jgi:hypothetical protein